MNGTSHRRCQNNESKSFCIFPRIYAETLQNDKENVQTEPKETGWDRLAIMFAKTDSGNFSPEMEFIRTGVVLAAFIGGCIGGISGTKYTRENFRRRNMETKYVSTYAASRQMHDEITMTFMRGALFGSLKTSALLASYMTLVVATEVYTEKVGILEYFGAGVLTGSLFRFNLGLRGMVGGGFAGGILGFTLGCCVKGMFWLSGISYQDMKYWRHDAWREEIERKEEKKREKQRQKELKSEMKVLKAELE